MPSEAELTLSMDSSPILLAPVRAMVERLARRAGFPQPEAELSALAVDEALANVIRHAYGGRHDCRIELVLRVLHDPAGIEVEVLDRGRTVDPETIRPRELEDVRPGGLGVHLIRSVMDECRWERREGGGMRLTMRKCCAAPSATSTE